MGNNAKINMSFFYYIYVILLLFFGDDEKNIIIFVGNKYQNQYGRE